MLLIASLGVSSTSLMPPVSYLVRSWRLFRSFTRTLGAITSSLHTILLLVRNLLASLVLRVATLDAVRCPFRLLVDISDATY